MIPLEVSMVSICATPLVQTGNDIESLRLISVDSAMALSTEINRKLSMSFPVWTSGVAQMLTIDTSSGIIDRRKDSDPSKFYRKLEQMAAAMAGPDNKPVA